MNPQHIISQATSLFSALERLNSLAGASRTLMAVDSTGRLTGTLTDGDVRRALLCGVSLQNKVSEVMHRDFMKLEEKHIDVAALRHARLLGIALVPVVDDEGRPVRLIDTRDTATMLPLSAVLMAGGRGERLRPLTLQTPKPLLSVGGKPIIDYNVAMLARAGIEDVTVTVNYMADRLEEHFSKPVEGVNVKIVRETQPLGTIGAAALVKRDDPDGNTLVMNSDLLTNIDLEEMWLRHSSGNADITVAAVSHNVSVPYAVLTTDGQRVTRLEEKPSFSYWVNAGIYIIANRLLDELSPDKRLDATDFIDSALARSFKVLYYPLKGTWIDIGSPADYRHACDLMELNPPVRTH